MIAASCRGRPKAACRANQAPITPANTSPLPGVADQECPELMLVIGSEPGVATSVNRPFRTTMIPNCSANAWVSVSRSVLEMPATSARVANSASWGVTTVAAVRLANNSMRSAFLARSLMPSASISRGILRLSKSRNSAVVAPPGPATHACTLPAVARLLAITSGVASNTKSRAAPT